jgi:hypothetical protein
MRSLLNSTVPLVFSLLLTAAATASAEERCKFSWDASAAETKYPQQLMMDVGDVPGHKVGAFELHRTFPGSKPNCEGRKIVEQWSHGFRDLNDRNGRAWGYTVLTLDNGDKIYEQFSGTLQTEVSADSSAKSSFEGTATWTGGTGRYQGVRGIQRDHAFVEYTAGGEAKSSQGHSDAEYWFEK